MTHGSTTTSSFGNSYSCNCNHSHSDIFDRLRKIENKLFTDKDDIIFEQKQEIERLNNKLDDIKNISNTAK